MWHKGPTRTVPAAVDMEKYRSKSSVRMLANALCGPQRVQNLTKCYDLRFVRSWLFVNTRLETHNNQSILRS